MTKAARNQRHALWAEMKRNALLPVMGLILLPSVAMNTMMILNNPSPALFWLALTVNVLIVSFNIFAISYVLKHAYDRVYRRMVKSMSAGSKPLVLNRKESARPANWNAFANQLLGDICHADETGTKSIAQYAAEQDVPVSFVHTLQGLSATDQLRLLQKKLKTQQRQANLIKKWQLRTYVKQLYKYNTWAECLTSGQREDLGIGLGFYWSLQGKPMSEYKRDHIHNTLARSFTGLHCILENDDRADQFAAAATNFYSVDMPALEKYYKKWLKAYRALYFSSTS